jgi:hypothetical protein
MKSMFMALRDAFEIQHGFVGLRADEHPIGYLLLFKQRATRMTNINIPTDKQFIENLILQRTGPFISYGGAGALNQWFARGDKAQLFDFLAKNNFLRRFLQDTFNDISQEAVSWTVRSGLPINMPVPSVPI